MEVKSHIVAFLSGETLQDNRVIFAGVKNSCTVNSLCTQGQIQDLLRCSNSTRGTDSNVEQRNMLFVQYLGLAAPNLSTLPGPSMDSTQVQTQNANQPTNQIKQAKTCRIQTIFPASSWRVQFPRIQDVRWPCLSGGSSCWGLSAKLLMKRNQNSDLSRHSIDFGRTAGVILFQMAASLLPWEVFLENACREMQAFFACILCKRLHLSRSTFASVS